MTLLLKFPFTEDIKRHTDYFPLSYIPVGAGAGDGWGMDAGKMLGGEGWGRGPHLFL